ncbi:unnamed protein product [Paramecium pentaurelia]|uniref:Protein kinase domain-containing protein n=1 Tax=Paramecium pentaurelia TaxID=43138 RepID=A0A8S1YJI6_9CILI|nr:unnamed protein product [Paramecium pentaurelia]
MPTKAKYDEFEIQRFFGCREYKVKLGKNNQGQYFLLNFFHISERDQLQKLQNIQNIEHPAILKIVQIRNEGIYTKKNNTLLNRSCVIYEYPTGGELYEYLFQTGKFHEAQARVYFKQLVEGLISIHRLGLYHGELTTEVIYFSDAKTIKIGELGLNQIRKKKYTFETPTWNKENNNYEQSKDIFALGMILFILMVGKPPFSNTEKTNPNFSGLQSASQAIWKQLKMIYPNVAFTDEFMDLIEGMLTASPKNRMSLSEVYNHPWTQIQSEFTEEMVREFNSKQKKIEQFLIKASLTRELKQGQMIISNNKQTLQTGLGLFRSENEATKQSEVIQEIQQIENKALKSISPDLMRSDSYLINLDPNQIMKLIKTKLDAKDFNLKFEKEQNEFSLIISSDLKTNIKMEIFQVETQENTLCLNFTKQKGDFFDYIETIKRFHQLIDNIQQELSNDSQGKEKTV